MRAAARWAAGEVVLIAGLVLLIVWIIKPLDSPPLDLAFRVLLGLLLLASPLIHGDSRRRLGLRVDNLGPAVASLLPASALAAGACFAIGLAFDSIRLPRRPDVELLYYLAWAGAQQYALQAVVLQRLQDAGLREKAPIAAAVLFSLVHAPNPGLMALTFLGGWLWSAVFFRRPNLFAVGLSHALLAVVAASTLPPAVIGGYRIGPSYLRHASLPFKIGQPGSDRTRQMDRWSPMPSATTCASPPAASSSAPVSRPSRC